MARFEKILIDKNGVDKREAGYYSTPLFISEYITNELLKINPFGKKVLDPAVGNEELLKFFFQKGKVIDSFDIIEYDDYRYSNFSKVDFIEFYKDKKVNQFFNSAIDLEYDYYIANPPYNCHEIDYIRENKKELNQIFNEVGVHNMYSMFFSAIIDLAKEGALIGIIVSDSFLTATMHSPLRQQIINNCTIHQVLLCPSDLFWSQKADVRTCIMILQKGKKYQKQILISNRAKDTSDFKRILNERKLKEVTIDQLLLGESKTANQFIIDIDDKITDLFKYKRLGDTFKCITGISTGNDSKYLSKEKKDGFTIPFYKNPGRRKFKTEPDAYIIDNFIDESLIVKDFMVRNKTYIFNEGITCSSMGLPFSACYLPEGATFGVNANIFPPKADIFWLISYLNSSLVTFLVRGILIRSNMVTSGYISQIPIPEFDNLIKDELSIISKDVINNNLSIHNAIKIIDDLVFKYLNINENTVSKIMAFANKLSISV